MINSSTIRSSMIPAVLLLAALAPAQEIRSERVHEVLDFLASDCLAGRDSPSPGLEEAAAYIAAAFEDAGLESAVTDGDDASWFHRYALPGVAFDTDEAEIVLVVDGVRRVLEPGADFRIWESGRAFDASGLAFEVEKPAAGDPRRRRRDMAGRRIRFLPVDDDDPAWRAADGGRAILSRRAAGGSPIVLLRREVVPTGEITVDVAIPGPRAVEVPLKNVVGVLRGTDLAEEFVLVTAHYDHVGVRPRVDGGDGIYNGADDDATGSTAVVCLAEHFAALPGRPRRSLMFVCFSAEEKGLRGSRAFCDAPPVPLEDIAAVVNLEMLGRPEAGRSGYAWITGAELSDFAAIAGPAFATAGVELVEPRMASRLFFAADNLPFAERGVVAHSISAGTSHQDYHQPSDEVELIAVEHMTTVIRGLAAVVQEFADRDLRPEYTESARQRLIR